MLLGAIITYMLSRTAVTNKIGTRLYATRIKQGTPMPCADVRVVAGRPEHHLRGFAGIDMAYVTFDCYSDKSAQEADEVANALLTSGIVGYRGTQAGVAFSTVECSAVPTQSIESDNPGTNTTRFVTSFSLAIWHSRAC